MELVISGADLFTAVGATTEITYFSVRSGLSRFTETGAITRRRKPRIAAVLPAFVHHRDESRLAALAAASAGRALDDAGIAPGHTVGITLCVPGSPRPDAAESLNVWRSAFDGVLKERGISARLRALVDAPASVAFALHEAYVSLEAGDEDATLIGGADSWLSLRALRWLEDQRRLKVDGRTEGLIPGEAAGFIVVESAERRVGAQGSLATLRAFTVAREPGHYDSDKPCLATGYTAATRAALAALDARRPPLVLLSDLNGESYKAKEWAAAEVRTLSHSPRLHIHPADCYGDVGSIAGVCQVAIAAVGFSRGEWSGPALVIAGADGSARGVVVVDGSSARLEPNLLAPIQARPERTDVAEMSKAILNDHLEEAGFLRLQRRLAEDRSAERWLTRDALDRRHAWHLLALAACATQVETTLLEASADDGRPAEDRAAAVTGLALAGAPSAIRGTWTLMKGRHSQPGALIEAFHDLPSEIRHSMERQLASHHDRRVRDLATALFQEPTDPEAGVTIDGRESTERRDRPTSPSVEGGRDRRADSDYSSQSSADTATHEAAAWRAAKHGQNDAPALARKLPEPEVTPRLLEALGGAGYTEAIPILLHFVNDRDLTRADAAGAALAAITGVDLVEPSDESEAADEHWCRSQERWRETLRREFANRDLLPRMIAGSLWSIDSATKLWRNPATRNGIRRTLLSVIESGSTLTGRTTDYYWLQRNESR